MTKSTAPLVYSDCPREVRTAIRSAQQRGERVGLVPTMGALHEGHLSLIDAARRECQMVVATIFVNPTQFSIHEDLAAYPRDLEGDLEKLRGRGCDFAFAPSIETMYPQGHSVFVEVGSVAAPWEGAARPTHFRGVATIVLKLFHIAPADVAYFGQKDYQQTLVVERLATDLHVPIEIRVCPIVREADGLAMSSRNAYLAPSERLRALALHRALSLAQRRFLEGERSTEVLRDEMFAQLNGWEDLEGMTNNVEFVVEYLAFLAAGTVLPVARITGPTIVALAARVGGTRLIDNCLLG